MQLRSWRDISSTPVLAVLFGLTAAACLVSLRFPGSTPDSVPVYLAAVVAAFACYFAALLLLRRGDVKLRAAWIFAVAVAIQIAPLRSTPLLDTDAYRYHWDGKLLAAGVNPYEFAPGDHTVASLRDEYWGPIDYKDVRTIYPPLTEMLLAGTYVLDRTPARIMLLAVGFNLLSLLPLLLLLRTRGIDDKWLALYAWNPLIASEFGAAGHLDAIAIFFLLSGLCAVQLKREWGAGSLLALAVMGKTQMLLAAPLVLWRAGWRGALAFAGVAAVMTAPFLAAGAGNVFSGHLTYLQFWEQNTGIFAVLKYLAGDLGARTVVIALMLGLAGYLTFRPGDVALHVGVLMGALLLVGPAFFPWYASWALPFASLFPTATAPVATLLLLAPKLGLYSKGLLVASRVGEFGLMYLCGVIEYLLWRRRRAPRVIASAAPRKVAQQDSDPGLETGGRAGGVVAYK